MLEYLLCINGGYVIHRIFSVIGDGACLFCFPSFAMHGTDLISREVRELIVTHVQGPIYTPGCPGAVTNMVPPPPYLFIIIIFT